MLRDWLKRITHLCSRSTGIVLGVVVLLSVIVFCSTSQGVRAYDTPAGYNANDYQKLVAFLELPNGVGKNGDKISASYNPEDPTTWDGVVWFNGAEKRVWGIIWSEKGLVGDLDVSDCTELGNIYNYFNQLTSLDVSGCTSLKRLFCFDNQLISLDVSGCTALVILSCSDNQLTMLDVSNCTALEELGCSSNQLTVLDVSGLSTLTTLSCKSNLLAELNVSDCTALNSLRCGTNRLTSLDVTGSAILTTLFCDSNRLTEFDVSGCTALGELVCDSNQLTSLDVSGLATLTKLSCKSNLLSELNVSGCTALGELVCDSNQLTSLDVSGLATLTKLSCKSNLLSELNVSDCTALVELVCDSNQLISLDVSGLTTLTTLSCKSNLLVELNVSGCTALDYLHCDDNRLTALDVSGLATLTKLSCKSNLLAELNVSDCTALVELVCDSNRLTALEMSDFATLTKLSCASNQLTALDLSGCTALYWLGCGYNKLTSLEVRGHMTLKHLYCYNNQLTSLDVSGCTALEYLFCNSNQLTALDVSGCTALDRLFCYSNQLTFTTLPFFDGTIYTYSPQNQIQVGSGGKVVIGSEIDLSAVSAVNGVDTVFTWYRYGWEIEPATSVNGIFTFEHGFGEQIIYCLMTNATFPELRLGTNKFLLIGPVKPEIVVQPQNITVATGIAAAFSVTATAIDADAGGILSYQWQQSTDGGNSWSDIADAVGNSYTTAAVTFANNGHQYRCIVTNTKDEITALVFSNPAILNVAATPTITSQPQNNVVAEGTSATFSVIAEVADSGIGGVLSYQWQQSTDGGSVWSNIDEATTNSHTTPAVTFANNGHQYRCQVINTREGVSATIFSNPATLSVVASPTIVNQPQDITALEGATVTFSVTAEVADAGAGGVLSFQWQLSTDGGSVWTSVDGAANNSYTTPPVTYTDNGHQYRCKVINTRNGVSGEAFSATATLTVKTHRITFVKPTADNEESNPVNINSGSLVLAQITGEIEEIATLTIKIDDGAEQTITPSGNAIFYLLPADLSDGWHTITIKLTNTVSYEIEATVTFYWDSYRQGFGFGRFDFGEADDH